MKWGLHLRRAELVRLKLEVIVSPGPAVTRPPKEATSGIAIVMTQDTAELMAQTAASILVILA